MGSAFRIGTSCTVAQIAKAGLNYRFGRLGF
jgi:hypothetical protein